MKSGHLKLLLARAGVRPTKKKGQSFLIREDIVDKEIEAAALTGDDTVLEIGPGIGILTERLCASAGSVVAVELEEGFVHLLEERLGHCENLTLIHADALELDFPPFNKVVSNIPYSISSPLLFKLMDYDFDRAVLILQEEFARRLTALPGMKDYSRLTVMVQLRCDVEELFSVPKTCFYPQPEVDSMAVALTPLPEEERPDIEDWHTLDVVVRAIFSHRRKKMRNCLQYALKELGIKDTAILEDEFEDELLDYRGENLFPDEIVDIANTIYEMSD